MRFMNDYDIQVATSTFIRASAPNLLGLTYVVEHLAEWANENSDGWAYWPKPARAAEKAMAAIAEGERRYREGYATGTVDCSDADVATYVRPIKAFLTRQGVTGERRERILRGVTG